MPARERGPGAEALGQAKRPAADYGVLLPSVFVCWREGETPFLETEEHAVSAHLLVQLVTPIQRVPLLSLYQPQYFCALLINPVVEIAAPGG